MTNSNRFSNIPTKNIRSKRTNKRIRFYLLNLCHLIWFYSKKRRINLFWVRFKLNRKWWICLLRNNPKMRIRFKHKKSEKFHFQMKKWSMISPSPLILRPSRMKISPNCRYLMIFDLKYNKCVRRLTRILAKLRKNTKKNLTWNHELWWKRPKSLMNNHNNKNHFNHPRKNMLKRIMLKAIKII